MNFFLLVVCTVLLSGCQNWGSSSLDEKKYTEVPVDPEADEDPNFKAANAVIKTRCLSCHNYHSEWAAYTSSAKWLNSSAIIPGNDLNSPLVNMLINEGGEMPRGAGAIPDAEYQSLKKWIREIPNP
jgi:uncharacterized membrane protein